MNKNAKHRIAKILKIDFKINTGNDLDIMDPEDVDEIYQILKGEQEDFDLSDEEMEEILDEILE